MSKIRAKAIHKGKPVGLTPPQLGLLVALIKRHQSYTFNREQAMYNQVASPYPEEEYVVVGMNTAFHRTSAQVLVDLGLAEWCRDRISVRLADMEE